MESPSAALRLGADAAKRFRKIDRAIAVIWKMLMVAEGRLIRLMKKVHKGAIYKDGIVVEPSLTRSLPDHVFTLILT